jgi:hypothetical protein
MLIFDDARPATERINPEFITSIAVAKRTGDDAGEYQHPDAADASTAAATDASATAASEQQKRTPYWGLIINNSILLRWARDTLEERKRVVIEKYEQKVSDFIPRKVMAVKGLFADFVAHFRKTLIATCKDFCIQAYR